MRPLLLASLVAAACAHTPRLDPKDGPPAPRALEPEASVTVTIARPTFRWKLASGTDGVRLEMCSDSRCDTVFHAIESRGESVVSDVDLPTGTIYWRLRGRTGERSGARPSEPRVLDIERTTEVAGKYSVISLPLEEREAAASITQLADDATVFFSGLFGRPLPTQPTPIFFYGTDGAYLRKWQEGQHFSTPEHYGAFTRWPGAVYEPYFPRVGRSRVGGPGALETTLVHEMAHAYQGTAFRHYNDEPKWLIEGLADLLSERVLEVRMGAAAATLPLFTGRVIATREAMAQKKFIPASRLISLPHDFPDKLEQRTLFYAEAYCLAALVDSPANPERQKRFRALLREELSMVAFLLESRINKKIVELFGTPEAMDREFVAWVLAQPNPPWERLGGDLRPLEGESFLLDSERSGGAIALSIQPPVSGGGIEAQVVTRDDGAAAACIVFGYRSPKDYYGLCFARSRVVLSHWTGKWERIAARSLLSWRGEAKLAMALQERIVIPFLDGKPLLEFVLPTPVSGRWGVGAYGGDLTVRSATYTAP